MLFNSIEYLFFLPIVFFLYWFVFDRLISGARHQLRLQNAFVLLASYVFYGWWDWRFLLLMAFTSLCSWGSGLLIEKADSRRKAKVWVWVSGVLNLGILATFKYYNFFVVEFAQLFNLATEGLLLKVILPVGISFYTFQALSYTIDVYRGKMEPTRDIVAFFAFISFFPQLVAGPIERATILLPQFLKRREFNYGIAVDGMRQILWGLFKKIVVADSCAVYVDQMFSTYTEQNGSTLMLAAILFAFQIYGDFSGYSDIAVGTAKLFGIKLMRNFDMPYFSRDIVEFWRRWHISLTTWFRDYVYIPLGGSRTSKAKTVRNVFVVFLVSGFWHGANWTFIAWGVYHAALYLPMVLAGKNRRCTKPIAEGRSLPTMKETGQMLLTFMLVVFGWIVFRSESIGQAWTFMGGIFGKSLFTIPALLSRKYYIPLMVALVVMVVFEWLHRGRQHGMDFMPEGRLWVKRVCYVLISVVVIYCYSSGLEKPHDFIYFQF